MNSQTLEKAGVGLSIGIFLAFMMLTILYGMYVNTYNSSYMQTPDPIKYIPDPEIWLEVMIIGAWKNTDWFALGTIMPFIAFGAAWFLFSKHFSRFLDRNATNCTIWSRISMLAWFLMAIPFVNIVAIYLVAISYLLIAINLKGLGQPTSKSQEIKQVDMAFFENTNAPDNDLWR